MCIQRDNISERADPVLCVVGEGTRGAQCHVTGSTLVEATVGPAMVALAKGSRLDQGLHFPLLRAGCAIIGEILVREFALVAGCLWDPLVVKGLDEVQEEILRGKSWLPTFLKMDVHKHEAVDLYTPEKVHKDGAPAFKALAHWCVALDSSVVSVHPSHVAVVINERNRHLNRDPLPHPLLVAECLDGSRSMACGYEVDILGVLPIDVDHCLTIAHRAHPPDKVTFFGANELF